MPSSLSDGNTGQAVSDETAKIFQEHGSFIRAVISAQVKNAADADDLFAELFLSLLRHPLPDNVRSVRAYLYRAIINDIMNFRLRRQRYESKKRDLIGMKTRCVQDEPDERLLELEMLTRAYELIEERRHKRHMEAVDLKYRRQYTSAEVASQMAVATRTIDRYVSIGVKELRTLIVREFGDKDDNS